MHPERYKSQIIFVKKKSMSPAAIGKRILAMKVSESPKEESAKPEMPKMI